MSAIQFTTTIGPDGVIRPPAGVVLPEGPVEVRVQPRAATEPPDDPMAPTRAWLLALAAEGEADASCQNLPSDMAENHDHYAHGREAMTEQFADASYFIALLNAKDQYHAAALAATRAIRVPLVTTAWVLMEVGDALCAPVMRRAAHRFLENTRNDPKITVVADLDPWLTRGLDLYGRRPDKSWSLTDCVSFEVMAERGIADALTADHHFAQAGFRTLLLPNPS